MDLTSKSITFHQNIVIARSGKVTDKSRSSTLSIAYYRRFLFLCIESIIKSRLIGQNVLIKTAVTLVNTGDTAV